MFGIKITFPAGRFHATPWARHVNEGAIEWPPSPRRLLRALIATWYWKCPDLAEEEVRQAVERLSPAPEFYLPPAIAAHTRHYMPQYQPGSTAKIFDAFVAIDKSASLYVVWPQLKSLTDRELETLKRLVGSLGYLGRAESWVNAEAVILDAKPSDEHIHVTSFSDQAAPADNRVRVLAVDSPEEYADWTSKMKARLEAERLAELQAKAVAKGKSPDSAKLSKKDGQKIEAMVPGDLFTSLQTDTADLRKEGWSDPPGGRWVDYAVPVDALTLHTNKRIRKTAHHYQTWEEAYLQTTQPRPTVARFAIVGKVFSQKTKAVQVLPQLTEAVLLGEKFRRVMLSFSDRVTRQMLPSLTENLTQMALDENNKQESKNSQQNAFLASPIFSGKNLKGVASQAGHQHAHFLTEANKPRGHVSHLTIYAPAGFQPWDIRALENLGEASVTAWLKNSYHLRLVLLGLGMPTDFNAHGASCPILGRSRSWVSRTPFVPSRHLKIRGYERQDRATFLEAVRRELVGQVRLELAHRKPLAEWAQEVEIEFTHDHLTGTSYGERLVAWRQFRRRRLKDKNAPPATDGYGFRITFPEPIQGPLTLGYAAHFGLGQFVPAE